MTHDCCPPQRSGTPGDGKPATDQSAVVLATISAVAAARKLIEMSSLDAEALSQLVHDLEAALRHKPFDPRRVFAVGPHSKAIDLTGRLCRLSLVEMIVREPGPDPVRTAMLLLRAIDWDHW